MTVKIDLQQLEKLASQGTSKNDMAAFFRMTPQGFRKKLKQDPELVQTIKSGEATGVIVIEGALMKKGREGSVVAQKYILSSRRKRWRDRNRKDDNKTATESRVLVIDESRGG